MVIAGLYLWLVPSPHIVDEHPIGKVRHIIDGDTVILNNDLRIRLWGVDAAERDETGYQEAKDELRRLVQGKPISYVIKDRDKYDRIVARIFLEDNTEVNQHLIEGKFTREYCHFCKGFYGHC